MNANLVPHLDITYADGTSQALNESQLESLEYETGHEQALDKGHIILHRALHVYNHVTYTPHVVSLIFGHVPVNLEVTGEQVIRWLSTGRCVVVGYAGVPCSSLSGIILARKSLDND